MNIDEFKIVIDDVRTRHKAEIDLMFYNGNQALNLLRTYISVGVATSAGSMALFDRVGIFKSIGFGLASTALMLFVGSWLCFGAMKGGKIALPGRLPDFWLSKDPHVRAAVQKSATVAAE